MKFTIHLFFCFFLAFSGLAQPISRHALLVGIGNYPKESKWPSLHADQDALRLQIELKKHDFLDRNTKVLTNQKATYDEIRLALKHVYDEAEPEDQVLLYFGGHSQQITDVSGDEEDHLDEAFVPYDAAPVFKGGGYEGSSHLLDDEIAKWLGRIGEKVTRLGSVFIIYDGGISTRLKSPVHSKGVLPIFRIPSYFKMKSPAEVIATDNDWLDVSFTEENSQLVTLDPGTPNGCSVSELKRPDGSFGSGLVSGFLNASKTSPSIRFRELNKYLIEGYRGSEGTCNHRLDGALHQEIFKAGTTRQFNPKTNETDNGAVGRIFSMAIGVSHYQNVEHLQYGHEDARMFYAMLQDVYGRKMEKENQYLFLDSNATIKPIIDGLEQISERVREGDKVYFYFAGHGDVENLLTRKAHLLLFNSPSHVYKAGGTLPMEDVKDYFKQWLYKKAKVFLVVDACKSGKLAGGLDGRNATGQLLQDFDSQSARLLSCQPNETSQENETFGGGHGAFTYYLVKGLTGKANQDQDEMITIKEIGRFISDSVAAATENEQNPMVVGNRNMIFLPVNRDFSMNSGQDLVGLKTMAFRTSVASDDSLMVRWTREFRNHLTAKRILVPEGQCAKAVFDRLTNLFPLDKGLRDKLKNELQNAIDRKSQDLINEYIKGNEDVAKEEVFASAAKELAYLLEMMEVDDPLYFTYVSRKYFFEGRSIKPSLVDNDLKRFQLKQAIRNLDAALKYEPEGAQNYNAIGRLRQVNLEYEAAIVSYKKAIQLAPSWKFPWNNLAAVYDEFAMAKNKPGFLDSSVYYYQKAISIDPNYAVALKNLGKTYWHQGKPGLAKEKYRRSIFINPGYVEAFQNLGDLYRLEQKWDSAGYYLQQGLLISPSDVDLTSNMGNLYFDQIYAQPQDKPRLLQKATTYYKTAIRLDSNCLGANLGLGHCYWEKEIYDSAGVFYRKCIWLDSNAVIYRNYYIESLMRGGKVEEANKEALIFSRKFPEDPMNWFDLGVIALLNKNEDLAMKRFEKAISLGLSDKAVFENEILIRNFRSGRRYQELLKKLK